MKFNKSYINNNAGFTLIELLVGMAIGLLVALVIVQVLQIFETQKRSTTGTADAQTNGSIALYNIGRELKVAGFPLMPAGSAGVADSPLECATLKKAGAVANIGLLSPVVITNGVAVAGVSPDSDTVTIHYGTSQSGGVASKIGALGGTIATVSSNFGCAVNDVTLVYDGDDCALSTVTAVTGTADPMSVTLQNTSVAAVGADLACLGRWDTVAYAVNQATGNLERSVTDNAGVTDVTPVVAGVVNLQAQYGVSASASSNQIVQWVEPTGVTWGATPTVANRNLIKAVRIAVLARNAKPETYAVSAACTQAVSPAPTSGICAWQDVPASTGALPSPITTASPAPVISLSPGNANWARYHYRVFETIIPLRNMVWSKDTL